jgi:cytoskeletal protein RodZ
MRIKRFITLAIVALLAVGAMGAVTYRAYAHGTSAPAAQTDACAQDQADGTELQPAGPDTDNVELQCGDQSTADGQDTVSASNASVGSVTISASNVPTGQATISATDTDNVNVEEQVGDQNATDTGAAGVEVPEPAQP